MLRIKNLGHRFVFTWVMLLLFCLDTKGQKTIASAKILNLKVLSILRDSAFITVDSVSRHPTLPYDQNYLMFQFVNTKDSSKKSFSYLLAGLDYEWITCNSCSQVQYAHLDGGEYTFKVKSVEPGAEPAIYSFKVEGNIWHQWWLVPMLLLYFLLIVGLGVYFFVLYQFRQKLKEQRLIHKEKMNSMTELTTGIAHEIQNPLNFVNNFSELSLELAQELKEELDNLDVNDSDKNYINEILSDLIQNQQKINHHGQQAGNIVKGMLEHSKVTSGQRELTDLNQLASEYLRLSYHGFFSRDKDFKAEFEMIADDNLPKVMLNPQDIGRVLINIFNNAFYAVHERNKKKEPAYKPNLTVRTEHIDRLVIIKVRDNGTGIPPGILDKIFQPFFTTKPTGQGTGLGLSLCYDIITKGHSGKMFVTSEAGQFTEITIRLPY